MFYLSCEMQTHSKVNHFFFLIYQSSELNVVERSEIYTVSTDSQRAMMLSFDQLSFILPMVCEFNSLLETFQFNAIEMFDHQERSSIPALPHRDQILANYQHYHNPKHRSAHSNDCLNYPSTSYHAKYYSHGDKMTQSASAYHQSSEYRNRFADVGYDSDVQRRDSPYNTNDLIVRHNSYTNQPAQMNGTTMVQQHMFHSAQHLPYVHQHTMSQRNSPADMQLYGNEASSGNDSPDGARRRLPMTPVMMIGSNRCITGHHRMLPQEPTANVSPPQEPSIEYLNARRGSGRRLPPTPEYLMQQAHAKLPPTPEQLSGQLHNATHYHSGPATLPPIPQIQQQQLYNNITTMNGAAYQQNYGAPVNYIDGAAAVDQDQPRQRIYQTHTQQLQQQHQQHRSNGSFALPYSQAYTTQQQSMAQTMAGNSNPTQQQAPISKITNLYTNTINAVRKMSADPRLAVAKLQNIITSDVNNSYSMEQINDGFLPHKEAAFMSNHDMKNQGSKDSDFGSQGSGAESPVRSISSIQRPDSPMTAAMKQLEESTRRRKSSVLTANLAAKYGIQTHGKPQEHSITRLKPCGAGCIHISVQYYSVRQRLKVLLHRIDGMPPAPKNVKDYQVKVDLELKEGDYKSQNSKEVIVANRVAAFNEEYFFDKVTFEDLKKVGLYIECKFQDSKKAYQFLGCTTIQVAYIPDILSKKEVQIKEELKPNFAKKLGRLHITTMLQTSSKCLTINVVKVEDLPKNPYSNNAPDPLVRITLEQGDKCQTKQTRTLKHSTSAVYKEAVMFVMQVDKKDLQEAKITIGVHDGARTASGADLIGCCFLGRLAIDKTESDQWRQTTHSTGREHKGMHILKPPQERALGPNPLLDVSAASLLAEGSDEESDAQTPKADAYDPMAYESEDD